MQCWCWCLPHVLQWRLHTQYLLQNFRRSLFSRGDCRMRWKTAKTFISRKESQLHTHNAQIVQIVLFQVSLDAIRRRFRHQRNHRGGIRSKLTEVWVDLRVQGMKWSKCGGDNKYTFITTYQIWSLPADALIQDDTTNFFTEVSLSKMCPATEQDYVVFSRYRFCEMKTYASQQAFIWIHNTTDSRGNKTWPVTLTIIRQFNLLPS